MTKSRCDSCNRNFKNEESLAMHNSAVHSSYQKSNSDNKKIKSWIIGLIILAIILGLAVWIFAPIITGGAVGVSNSCQTISATEMNIGGHQNLALHIHSNLEIIIDGIPQIIPADIGIESGIMRPIHTHDSTGKIHIEAQCVRTFYLEEFFDIWGREFSTNQIFDRTTVEGTLIITVNGQPSNQFEKLPLRDGDK